jgi:PAS domain S-box-containing protein
MPANTTYSAVVDLLFEDEFVGRCLVAPDGTVLRANREWLRSTGFALDDVLGADIIEQFPDTRDVALAMHARARAGHRVAVPRHARTIEGVETWWEGSIAPVPMDGGTGLLITTREACGRAAPAGPSDAVVPEDEQLRSIAEDAPFAVFAEAADGRYVYVNRYVAGLFGTTPERLIGHRVADILPLDGAVRTGERRPRAASGHTWTQDVIPTPNGRRTMLASRFPVRFRDGEIGTCGIAFDISEQVEAGEAAKRAEAVLSHAGAMAQLGAWWIEIANEDDLNSNPLRWSDEVFRIFGYEPGEVHVTNDLFFRHVHPDDRKLISDAVARSIASGERYSVEHRVIRRDGVERTVLERGEAQRDGSGRLLRIVGAVQDVTERKRAEEALREMNEQLRDADRRKDEFLGMLSHELRNPLAPIRNSIHLMERTAPDSEAARRGRAVIRRQTDHLARLVDDLLDITRITRGKIELHRERLDAREVVRKITEDLHGVFEQAGIDLRVEHMGFTPVSVDVDPMRLSQVIGNLLQNAAKFTPTGGAVTVSLTSGQGWAELRVRDTGRGIEPAQVQRMFEPFVQAEQSLARSKGGLGLGLALVKGLVEQHGGTVEGRSAGVGCGAEFVVRVPLAPASAVDVAGHATAPTLRRRIVIIEDNVDAAETLAELLVLEGHEVSTARDARSGVALVRAQVPDVVLCDLGLPDADGYEVARALRRDDALRRVRLIALSGYAQPEDRDRARAAGFDDHVAKPPNLDELERLLAAEP